MSVAPGGFLGDVRTPYTEGSSEVADRFVAIIKDAVVCGGLAPAQLVRELERTTLDGRLRVRPIMADARHATIGDMERMAQVYIACNAAHVRLCSHRTGTPVAPASEGALFTLANSIIKEWGDDEPHRAVFPIGAVVTDSAPDTFGVQTYTLWALCVLTKAPGRAFVCTTVHAVDRYTLAEFTAIANVVDSMEDAFARSGVPHEMRKVDLGAAHTAADSGPVCEYVAYLHGTMAPPVELYDSPEAHSAHIDTYLLGYPQTRFVPTWNWLGCMVHTSARTHGDEEWFKYTATQRLLTHTSVLVLQIVRMAACREALAPDAPLRKTPFLAHQSAGECAPMLDAYAHFRRATTVLIISSSGHTVVAHAPQYPVSVPAQSKDVWSKLCVLTYEYNDGLQAFTLPTKKNVSVSSEGGELRCTLRTACASKPADMLDIKTFAVNYFGIIDDKTPVLIVGPEYAAASGATTTGQYTDDVRSETQYTFVDTHRVHMAMQTLTHATPAIDLYAAMDYLVGRDNYSTHHALLMRLASASAGNIAGDVGTIVRTAAAAAAVDTDEDEPADSDEFTVLPAPEDTQQTATAAAAAAAEGTQQDTGEPDASATPLPPPPPEYSMSPPPTEHSVPPPPPLDVSTAEIHGGPAEEPVGLIQTVETAFRKAPRGA